jgi:hypothetical protein
MDHKRKWYYGGCYCGGENGCNGHVTPHPTQAPLASSHRIFWEGAMNEVVEIQRRLGKSNVVGGMLVERMREIQKILDCE